VTGNQKMRRCFLFTFPDSADKMEAGNENVHDFPEKQPETQRVKHLLHPGNSPWKRPLIAKDPVPD